MSIDSAKILCPNAVDTIEHDELGDRIRVLVGRVNDDTIRVYAEGTIIGAIWLTSPAFRTADSLHVGMPLRRLLGLANLHAAPGEGAFFLLDDSGSACGLSFTLDHATEAKLQAARIVNRETIRPYASSGRITGVVVRGCRSP